MNLKDIPLESLLNEVRRRGDGVSAWKKRSVSEDPMPSEVYMIKSKNILISIKEEFRNKVREDGYFFEGFCIGYKARDFFYYYSYNSDHEGYLFPQFIEYWCYFEEVMGG